ncbi:flavin reductase [Agrobacterium larrymoorei]|uniref:FMN reductase (NADH) RutF n=1 Tax=Agrobacterium larrymoorei TaxID=160699 RepID=A0AAJ2EPY0_9HYPH|nr:pyrimidine utilization flavin reductase protein F [Agrobacterium larrymoorei]MDR6100526.1 flavin reductase [Agrobacterium larrymoorei]
MNAMTTVTAELETADELSQADFRNAMAKMGAAVNIITTDGPGGKAGFAASAVCSVTDTPPTLLICLNRSSSVFETFQTNKALCVNTLGGDHEKLSSLFGGKTPVEERFAAARWERGLTGAPLLTDSVVSFDCIVSESVDVGTHKVLFCRVVAIHEGGAVEALIYYQRGYHRIRHS